MAEGTERAPRISNDAVIRLKIEKNPKREGSKAFERFAKYEDGMTVGDAKKAGLTASDISYDSKQGFIEVNESQVAESEAA